MTIRRAHLFLLAAAPLAIAASAAAAASGLGSTTQVVSNEKTLTRWAHSQQKAPIYEEPSAAGRRIARLRYLTEDRKPEVYLVLKLRTDGTATWAKIRIPMRPNGRTGWVRRSALGPLHTVRTRIIVNEGRLRATLYWGGRAIWTSRIGVGKPSTPTPKGHFYVREKLADYASPFYGPVALGTSDYSRLSEWPHGGVVGIHGTSEPQLLPGRVSHGCIRVPNRAVVRLAALVPIGTPIWIR
jgi:lipoprotein-anchoring transpeptidase ErfK/SrfK